MRITCPSCAAEYEVPGTLAAGRVVRCAKCAGQWTPVALPAEAAAEPMPPPPLEPAQLEPAQPEPAQPREPPVPIPAITAPRRVPFDIEKQLRPSPAPLIAAWVVSAAVLAALVAAAIVWRDPVMHAWPPSLRLYAALGMR